MKKLTYTDMLAVLGISSAHPGGSNLTKNIFSREKITEDMKLLDVGCGTGQTSAFLAKKFNCEIAAIDLNNTMLEKAAKRFKKNGLNVKTINASAEKLPFKDNVFDYIISESVIIFTNSEVSLAEIRRVLKPSGKFIAIEMVAETNLSQAEKEEIINVYGINQIFTEGDWENQFRNLSFSKVKIEKDEWSKDREFLGDKNDPSSYIAPQLFKILEAHTELIQKYHDRLGYRIFTCFK